MVFDMSNPTEVAMYFNYLPPVQLSRTMKSILRPGDVFVDCGANVGYFTFLAATLVGSSGHVLAIEPVPYCVDRMRASVEVGGYDNVSLIDGAVGEQEAEMPFHVTTNPAYSTFADVSQLTFASLDSTIQVRVHKIDTLLENCVKTSSKPVRLVKIDVEGAELHALRGMSRILENKRADYVYVELHPSRLALQNIQVRDVLQALEEHGYSEKEWYTQHCVLFHSERRQSTFPATRC